MSAVKQPVCLIVIDGWGISAETRGNAILNAQTPNMDRLAAANSTELEAHGLHVGLPEGLMGNSEVGHLNIGAGRVIDQDIVRINKAVRTKSIYDNKAFVQACWNAKSKNGRLHFLGLVSDGGVHSHIEHLLGLIEAAKHHNVPQCFIHFFGDGRDTSPTSGVTYAQQLLDFCHKVGYGSLSTVVGRYYAMDRDKRWERVQVAYDALLGGVGESCKPEAVVNLIKQRYEGGETDEFLKPIIVNSGGRIKEHDTLVFFNYRADRMRQIVETFGVRRNFTSQFSHPEGLHIACMTQYNKDFTTLPLLFPAESHVNVLAEWLAKKGLTQYHCAETEKYAHVTFFFNGGREAAFENEERCMIASPKVATYDLQPEMSCQQVADQMASVIATKKHPFVMCNLAPPDMVGHSGVYEAAVKACEATDAAILTIEKACLEHGYVLMITADHGNAEQMLDAVGGKHTAHTCNKVPFISTGAQRLSQANWQRPAGLCDVATTVLACMGLDIPKEMTGLSLLS